MTTFDPQQPKPDRPHVEITVIAVKGSAPREPGARMMWLPDGQVEGTIGGGNLEQQCISEAAKLWSDPERTTAILEYPLSAKLGQCCGGHVTVFLLKRLPPHEVVICGGGHVSTALAGILAASPLKVTVVDSRAEWADAARFPEKITVVQDDPEAFVRGIGERAARTYLLIMTHEHPVDQALCQVALRDPFLWIGMIGSRTKWLRFQQRMAARGFSPDEIARITCPIGHPELGRTPHEIAIGVSAQLMALYHGVADPVKVREIERPAGARAALVLAGGASKRMGRWKGGIEADGVALAAAHVSTLNAAGADVCKVVYPNIFQAEAEKIVAPAHRIMTAAPDAPMFQSLQLGLRALIAERVDLASLLVTPVDLFPLDEDWIAAMWDRHEASGAWVTQPETRDKSTAASTDSPIAPSASATVRHGHPVILDQRLFAPILAADPATARLDFIIRDLAPELKAAFELEGGANLLNLNTPEDIEEVVPQKLRGTQKAANE